MFGGLVRRTVKRFESEHRELFDRRDAWLRKHPRYDRLEPLEWHVEDRCPKRVLVVAPHPDDEIIGCGGTLSRLIAAGSGVIVLHVTDGSGTAALKDAPDEVRRVIRLQEAREVADAMGFVDTVVWGTPEEDLVCTTEWAAKLRSLLERVMPELVFVPFVNDPHPDHVKVNTLLAEALAGSNLRCESLRIAGYEVWSVVPANLVCVIDEQWDTKTRMMMKYRTAMKRVDYVKSCEALNTYRSRTLLGRRGLAEAFFEVDAASYVRLVKGSEIEGLKVEGLRV